MANEQQQDLREEQSRHDGGSVSEAPESGAMGTRQNESATSARHGTSGDQSEQGQGGASRASSSRSGPLSLMRRISDDMDRLFEGFFGPSPFTNAGLFGGPSRLFEGDSPFGLGRAARWPQIEVHQEGDRLVIQADVPGLNREDLQVELRDAQLVISGERRTQSERQEGGFYHSERSYGSFSRAIPLPENAAAESASASFENGVLRVEIAAPQTQQSRGRRIEIRDGKPQ